MATQIIAPTTKPNEAAVSDDAWYALGAVGAVFVVVGLTDLVLAWVPLRLGNPDWEFGTVSAMLNNLAVPAMGVALAAASAAALRARRGRTAVGVVAGVLVLWLLGSVVLYGLTVPLALRSVTDPVPRQALFSGIVKAVVQFGAYLVFFGWAVRFCFGRSR
ncbi:MAG: hypothetical protein ACT4R6_05855 [Gemmatimonadaceae bacterium]